MLTSSDGHHIYSWPIQIWNLYIARSLLSILHNCFKHIIISKKMLFDALIDTKWLELLVIDIRFWRQCLLLKKLNYFQTCANFLVCDINCMLGVASSQSKSTKSCLATTTTESTIRRRWQSNWKYIPVGQFNHCGFFANWCPIPICQEMINSKQWYSVEVECNFEASRSTGTSMKVNIINSITQEGNDDNFCRWSPRIAKIHFHRIKSNRI